MKSYPRVSKISLSCTLPGVRTKNKIKKTIRATKLKQKQNKQIKINCNKKVIIKNIKKPNKTNKQKYQTKENE
jgi:hypothetical protein